MIWILEWRRFKFFSCKLVPRSFKIYGEVLGIDFVETTASNADFLIGDDEGGYQAYSSSSVYTSTREIAQTWIQVSSSWTNYYGTGYNLTLGKLLFMKLDTH